VVISEVHNYNKVELVAELNEDEGSDLESIRKQIEELRKIARTEVRKPLLTRDAEEALSKLKRKKEITMKDITELPERIIYELIANGRLVWDDKWIII